MNQEASSALSTVGSPRPVTPISASLNFIRRQDAKPTFESSALTGGAPKYLFEPEAHTVTISDMREIAEDLSVDREGFELLHQVTAVTDLYDDDTRRGMPAPDIVMRTENQILEDAISALLEDDDIAEITDNIGINAFIDTFNLIAGTEIRLPSAATASHTA